MPNGGVPRYMLITPADDAGVVLRFEGAELSIFSKTEWESRTIEPVPLAKFNAKEGLVIERFLRYWLEDVGDGPLLNERAVKATFDY